MSLSAKEKLPWAAQRYVASGIACVPALPQEKIINLERMGLKLYGEVPQERFFFTYNNYISAVLAGIDAPRSLNLRHLFCKTYDNIALVTGYNGFIALDFDCPRLFQKWCRRKPYLAINTPIQKSGNGFHVLLRLPKDIESRRAWFGKHRISHIKGIGGYILAWPSQHPSGRHYQWLPGQAPWEIEVQSVESLEATGITTFSCPWSKRLERALRAKLQSLRSLLGTEAAQG